MKIRKGDKIKIMQGKDRGQQGVVQQVLPRQAKVVIEGLNLRFRHLRPKRANEKGQRVQFPAPIAASNVMLVCPKCSKATRVGHKLGDNSKKERMCRKCQATFD